MHIHKWEQLWDVYFGANPSKYEVERIYRHCLVCNKWQRYHSEWGEPSWEDSNEPLGTEYLISKKEAVTRIKKIEMYRESI
jgi:hypothetical protein